MPPSLERRLIRTTLGKKQSIRLVTDEFIPRILPAFQNSSRVNTKLNVSVHTDFFHRDKTDCGGPPTESIT